MGRATLWQHWVRTSAIAAILLSLHFPIQAEDAPASPQNGPITSLGDSLRRSETRQLHILYVHGMAADGPGDFDSWGLRKSICDFFKDCTAPAGVLESHEYADEDEFKLNAPPPDLAYLGQPVWKHDDPSSPSSKEWNAATPYVQHWRLIRASGPTVYVDEINWWPLVFALKCRQILQADAALIGPDQKRIGLCAKSEPDPEFPGRFISYPWIKDNSNVDPQVHGALANRNLKNSLLDWGFSDAVLAVGPLRPLLLDGIRQLVLKSVNVGANGSRNNSSPRADQEFVIVSHSLGSYLIFSALDNRSTASSTATAERGKPEFEYILSHTSMVYFFANQLRLLELADLDPTASSNILLQLQTWADLRQRYLSASKIDEPPPQIVAWNDPSDLLTWNVPCLPSVTVRNITVKNAWNWFGLFESPAKAHDRYAQNNKVIREMLKPVKTEKSRPDPACTTP